MSMISSLAGAASSMQGSNVKNDVGAALMRKTLDVQKLEGAAILELIEKSTVPASRPTTGSSLGQHIDIRA